MRRFVLALASATALAAPIVAVGCGGTKIPAHAGYKTDKARPWGKAKALKLDERGEAKIDGELDYAAYRRARWFAVALPAAGELAVALEVTPPGEGSAEDFDLALEVLDPSSRVIAKSDLEEDDAGELAKTRTLRDLEPGRYLIHVYLQGRLDTADFVLRVAFKPSSSGSAVARASDFPAQVAFVPALPAVAARDDAPAKYRPPATTGVARPRLPTRKTDPTPAPATMSARIVGVSVVGTSTRVVLGRGTATGARSGMKAKLGGIPGSFAVECGETTCVAIVSATPDQVRGAGGSATLVP